MKPFIKCVLLQIKIPIDLILSITIIPCAYMLLFFRRMRGKNLPLTNKILKLIGVYPIRDHYHEPLFNEKHLTQALDVERKLPGIDFREQSQIELLSRLCYAQEFKDYIEEQNIKNRMERFLIRNGSFECGDAEFLFQFVRHFKPKKIIEIGCGNSTKITSKALSLNHEKDSIPSTHICIEPYEQPWLDTFSNIKLIRQKLEDYEFSWGEELNAGDLLFVDSSHVIRPQGDVLKEYLEIFPQLKSGVFVHIHDIFSPRDYLSEWIVDDVRFWNEQYLLEAMLGNTSRYEIIASLNFLKHSYFEDLERVCPFLTDKNEPCSLYFRVK